MKLACCTIVTPSHFNKAIVLLESLRRQNPNFRLFVLTTESVPYNPEGIEVINLTTLAVLDSGAALVLEKYSSNMDALRWSLKPILIRYILNAHQGSSVIYCDCDMYFFSNPVDLIAGLEQGGIVLTPHWRPLEPFPSIHNFRLNFQDGLFNAGCIAANENGLPALDWWARACLSGCEMNREAGLYHDQRYLDLMPIYFPQTVICRNQGYNVADWNYHIRALLADEGKSLKICLVHFSENTVKKVAAGKDIYLESYYDIYTQHLNEITNRFYPNGPNHSLSYQLEKAR